LKPSSWGKEEETVDGAPQQRKRDANNREIGADLQTFASNGQLNYDKTISVSDRTWRLNGFKP
jgi:hypothetical protein